MLRKQHQVDEYHNDMPLIYYVEGHSLHFGRPEFALITGMRFGTISFCSYTSADLKFRNRVFPHKVDLVVTNLDVLGVIEDEVMFRNLDRTFWGARVPLFIGLLGGLPLSCGSVLWEPSVRLVVPGHSQLVWA
ncbi:hypothetical protein Tco_0420466 [Tanacetum coccineum]